ncbi:MAG: DUF4838 domain-containing protein [Halobacteriaceae archaeon]
MQPTHDPVALVEGGEPAGRIAWSSGDDSPVPAFAADELRDYVRAMTDTDLPVGEVAVESDAASLVVAGDPDRAGDLADEVDAAIADHPDDAFALRSTAGAVAAGGTTHRGTLYAVYALLERVGVRFFAPDFAFYEGRHERVPERESVAFDPLDRVAAPDVQYRRKYVEEGISHTPETVAALADWMAKTHNVLVCPTDYRSYGFTRWADFREALVPELERRGLLVEVGGHGFDSFLPPGEFPEWYGEANVFDISAAAAREQYVENVCAYLADHPEIDVFDAWPPDQATWPDAAVEAYGSVANAYAALVNDLVAGIEERDLEVTVEAIAYQSHLDVPDPEYMYDDSVIVDFAAIDRSYAAPIDDPGEAENADYLDTLAEWRAAFDGTMGLYEYYRKYSWHSLPVVLADLLADDIPGYVDVGLDAVGSYSEPADWLTYELTHLLVAALAWDTDLDGDGYVGRYVNERYGPAGGAVGSYLLHVEDAGRTLFDSFEGRLDDPDAVASALDSYERAQDVLADARETLPGDSDAAFLIDRLLGNLDYALADMELAAAELADDRTAEARARQRFEAAMLAERFAGTVLANRVAINRYTDLDVPSSARFTKEVYRERW